MLDGFGYVFSQVAVLLLAGVGLGLLVGRYLPPRRPRGGPSEPQPVSEPSSAVSSTPGDDAVEPPADGATEARLAYVQTRFHQSEARRAELEARLAEAQTQLARATTGLAGLQGQAVRTSSELDQARAELAQSQATHGETRRQLAEADAEVVRLRLQARDLADRKETEMGRLESGAIAALDSTIAAHQEQVARLEERLKAAGQAAEQHDRDLAHERRRSEQLQAALADRDQHLSRLAAGGAQRPPTPRQENPGQENPKQEDPRSETGVGQASDAR